LTDQPIDPPAEVPAAAGQPEVPKTPKRKRRLLRRALKVLAALLAAIVVLPFSIDLGPSLRKRAETAGSNWLDRPMHMGRLSILLGRGAFQVDDLVIEGLKPGDRPFLKAKRVWVYLPWWTAFSRELIVDTVVMSDWDMVVEQFRAGTAFRVSPARSASRIRTADRRASRRRPGRSSRRAARSRTTITPCRGKWCARISM
jgi:hypothetical protein